ncbi:hypothetical protein [uncultured Pseudomonas sp.]|uniref:hypothetical protein n=1 Tax=uncultured Pseudomonas sp. TaxID=114707 RepID=UPI0025E79471|nr:hypothetical protein [uncultured Pseudomonas sp.]
MSDSNAQYVEWLEQNIVARSLINDQLLWQAWEASRQVLAVALPSRSDSKYMEYFPDVEGGVFNERAYMADFRAAIEAAGVRVKA